MPSSWLLVLGAALFCVGVYGVLANRNLVTIILALALMLNAVVLNLVTFALYLEPPRVTATAFALVVSAVGAAEITLGMVLATVVWRAHGTVAADELVCREAIGDQSTGE
jgi:NADH:ubiquinone oxidoreductase subunit K